MTAKEVWAFFPEWFWWVFVGLYALTIVLMIANALMRRYLDHQIAEWAATCGEHGSKTQNDL